MKLKANKDFYICPHCEGNGYTVRSIHDFRENPLSDTIICRRCGGKRFVIDPHVLGKMKDKLFGRLG